MISVVMRCLRRWYHGISFPCATGYFAAIALAAVSYTHLTLPTNREV